MSYPLKGWLAELKKFDTVLAASKNADIQVLRKHLSAGLSQAPGLAVTVTSGAAAVMALSEDQFLAA